MYIKIPFVSEIPFNTCVSEIITLSLEEEHNVNEGVILGNFYVSGDYKTHEVSLNKEEFKFTLPYQVELSSDVDLNTIEVNIEDFNYELKDNNILKVDIEYSVKGDIKKEELFERVDESTFSDELDLIDNFLEENSTSEIPSTKEDVKEEIKEDKNDIREEKEETKEDIKDRIDEEYITYHIHIVNKEENIDSICKLYNIDKKTLELYNDISNLNMNDKLLIPLDNE